MKTLKIFILLPLALLGSSLLIWDASTFFDRFATFQPLSFLSFGLLCSLLVEGFIALFSIFRSDSDNGNKWFINLLLICFSILAVTTSAFSIILPELEKIHEQQNLEAMLSLRKENSDLNKNGEKYLKEKGQVVNYIVMQRKRQASVDEMIELLKKSKNVSTSVFSVSLLLVFKVLLQIGTITLYSLIGKLLRKVDFKQESNKTYERKSVEFFEKKGSVSDVSDSLPVLSDNASVSSDSFSQSGDTNSESGDTSIKVSDKNCSYQSLQELFEKSNFENIRALSEATKIHRPTLSAVITKEAEVRKFLLGAVKEKTVHGFG